MEAAHVYAVISKMMSHLSLVGAIMVDPQIQAQQMTQVTTLSGSIIALLDCESVIMNYFVSRVTSPSGVTHGSFAPGKCRMLVRRFRA